MTAWGRLLCLTCVGATIMALPGQASAEADGNGRGLVLSSFELKGSHGYLVNVEGAVGAALPSTVAVTVERGHLRASYEVPGEVDPGLRAVFGSLGAVAVDFQRRKRTVDRPEKGCTYITETGTFSGEFSFVGESAYTAAAATSVPGEVLRLPNGFCGFSDDRRGIPTPDFLRSDQLLARSRLQAGSVRFDATAQGGGARYGFSALLREISGAMTISRSAAASSSSGGLFLGPGKQPRRASVEPPAPFMGSARFRDPASGPPSWRGSLSVSLPGAPDVALAGPGFSSKICPQLGIFGECKIPLPPR
jgi:hypothetical protein